MLLGLVLYHNTTGGTYGTLVAATKTAYGETDDGQTRLIVRGTATIQHHIANINSGILYFFKLMSVHKLDQ